MPALVLLHGFAQTPASWRQVAEALPYPVTLCPNPGHSPDLPLGADWAATIALLAARIPRDATVVGYSLGARLALGLLAEDAIAAAVLIGVNPGLADTGAGDGDGADERTARRALDAAWAERLRRDGTAGFLDAWEAQPIFATAARAPQAIRDARRAARARLDPHALADAMEVLGLGAMPDLRAPLLARADRARLIVGADDAKFRAVAAALGLPTTIIAHSGHDPTLEAPVALAAELSR